MPKSVAGAPSRLPDDQLVSAATADLAARVAVVTLSHGVEAARAAHATLPVATAALGRAMAAALLLAHGLKAPERLTLRLIGDGPLGAVVADASPEGDVRGYVQNPRVMLAPTADGKLDVGRAVGRHGVVHVSHDTSLGPPYTSSVPLVSGEIGEDVARYLAVSTQVPSAVAVGVRLGPGGSVLGAAGILAQRLPDGDERSVERLEAALTALGPVSAAAASGLGALDLLERLLGNLGHGEVRALPVRWRCGCNRERTARLVAALGRKTLDAMIVEDGGAELVCQFCGAVYRFDADELGELRDRALDQPPPGRGDANGPPRRP